MRFKVTFEFYDGTVVAVSRYEKDNATDAHAGVNAAYAVDLPNLSKLHNGLVSVGVEREEDA